MRNTSSGDLPPNGVLAYRFADFRLDLVEESLSRHGQRLNISPRMFQVLLLLVQRRGEVVTKGEFFDKVWGGTFVEDNNLTVTIAALRKILKDHAKQATFIENLPRKGYRFLAAVEVDGESTEGPVGTNRSLQSQPRSRRRAVRYGLATLGLLIVLSIVGLSFKNSWRKAAPGKRIDSLAVLPFASTDSDGEYTADGMTEGISSALSKIPTLRVIDRNSTNHYKDSNDAVEAARELNVETVVTGTIDRHPDVPVVNVILTDVVENKILWQQEFPLSEGETLLVQRELIRILAQNLNRSTTDERAIDRPPTENAEAYDLYIKGRYYWGKRSNPDILRSAEFFKAAIEKDPNFAKAYIGLADAYAIGDFVYVGIAAEQRTTLAKSYVQKALEIDNTLGEGYAVVALGQCYSEWNFVGAEQNYRRAIELSPNDATAHHWFAEFLSMQGRFGESLEEYARAMSLDPLSMSIRTDRALSFYYARDYDRAVNYLNEARQVDPDYSLTYTFLDWVYREKGMYAEAADAMEKVYALQQKKGERGEATMKRFERYADQLRNGAAAHGDRGYWRVMADSEVTMGAGPYYVAVAHAKLGENDEAFKYLEMAFRDHYTGFVWLKVDPAIENLRQDPRFNNLLRRVGI